MGEGVCDASADPQDPLGFSSSWLWLEPGWYQPSVLDRLILVRMRWLYFPHILLSQWKSQAQGLGNRWKCSAAARLALGFRAAENSFG